MDRDDYADMFRFPLGACVRWAESPSHRYYIGQRRWTQREILSPVVEYHLRLGDSKGYFIAWVLEPDVMAWEDT